MRLRAAPIVAVLVLAACASPALPITAPDPPPAPVSQPVAPAPPAAMATPVPKPRDSCGAAELQGLIGRPRTEIPVPLEPDRQRVACTTCPVTQDVRPERLNFFFDAGTGQIREIRCG